MKWLINELGQSQVQFSESIGISESMVSRWIAGENNPSRKTIARIAETFNLHPINTVVFIEKGKKRRDIEAEIHGQPSRNHRPKNFPAGKIPLVGRVPAAKGAQGVSDYTEAWAEAFVDQGPWAGSNSQAFSVHGDSMEPTLREGMIVVADPDVQPTDNCLVVVQFYQSRNEENTIKRMIAMEDGRLKLMSDNPKREPIIVTREDVAWLGVVIEKRERVR